MARAQFEYDEVGNTFYYVLVSFYAIILIPVTWFFFPTGKEGEQKLDESLCHCEGCVEKERQRRANQPWKRTKKVMAAVLLLIAWAFFVFLAKKVSEIETVHEEYDPYGILGLDQGSPTEAVKKAYRVLSKQHHPDRGGDPVMFDKIAKAYQALTDDESRENWEKYGNPDGPTAATFGIALPKWLVSKEYGSWVLALYGAVFIIILPICVGVWWYNSIKYSVDKVLLDTTQLFGHFIIKTPNMEVHRMLRILGGAFEFSRHYNKEIIERETDDVELPRLMKEIKNLGESKKEYPLSAPYALKARILLYSHFSRLPLNSVFLETDQRYIVRKLPILIEEMLSLAQQIYYTYPQKRPSVEMIENLIKLFPMSVQALWPKNSALLQLPHIDEGQLYHVRRNRINTCSDLAKLDEEKRRAVLKNLSDTQYRDVLAVLTSMPRLSIETSFEVEGEDDKHEITAGCFVTLRVKLTRKSLLGNDVLVEAQRKATSNEEDEGSVVEELSDEEEGVLKEGEGDKKDEAEEEGTKTSNAPKKKVWAKQPKKKQNKPKKGQKQQQRRPAPAVAPVSVKKNEEEAKEEEVEKEDKEGSDGENDSDSMADDDERLAPKADSQADESDDQLLATIRRKQIHQQQCENYCEDDEDWTPSKKKITFESASRNTHRVHCPRFPGEKFEWWWLMLQNKQKRLCSPVIPCKTLVDSTTMDLRFEAPEKGIHYLQLSVRSDSYVDCDYIVDIKLDVKEARKVETMKYEDTEDEEKKSAEESSSEYTEESDDD